MNDEVDDVREYILNQFGDAAASLYDRKFNPNDLFDFDGMNCDDDCGGWDGISPRCSCRNRRVDWVWRPEVGQFGDLYGEAW